jgi:hypothetical protein
MRLLHYGPVITSFSMDCAWRPITRRTIRGSADFDGSPLHYIDVRLLIAIQVPTHDTHAAAWRALHLLFATRSSFSLFRFSRRIYTTQRKAACTTLPRRKKWRRWCFTMCLIAFLADSDIASRLVLHSQPENSTTWTPTAIDLIASMSRIGPTSLFSFCPS